MVFNFFFFTECSDQKIRQEKNKKLFKNEAELVNFVHRTVKFPIVPWYERFGHE